LLPIESNASIIPAPFDGRRDAVEDGGDRRRRLVHGDADHGDPREPLKQVRRHGVGGRLDQVDGTAGEHLRCRLDHVAIVDAVLEPVRAGRIADFGGDRDIEKEALPKAALLGLGAVAGMQRQPVDPENGDGQGLTDPRAPPAAPAP
jgi:hypothetical protein